MNANKIMGLGIVILLLLAGVTTGCKTGKGCDCPTFGKNESPKVTRF